MLVKTTSCGSVINIDWNEYCQKRKITRKRTYDEKRKCSIVQSKIDYFVCWNNISYMIKKMFVGTEYKKGEFGNMKKLVSFWVATVVFIAACIGMMITKENGQGFVRTIFVAAIVISMPTAIFCLEAVLSDKAYQKYKLNLPYGLDMRREYAVYRKIGNKSSKYKTYSEWKEYIKKEYACRYGAIKTDDFKHYLIKIVRNYEDSYDAITHIMIPLVIALFVFLLTIDNVGNVSSTVFTVEIAVTAFITTALLTRELIDAKTRIAFIKDCLDIFKEKQKEEDRIIEKNALKSCDDERDQEEYHSGDSHIRNIHTKE